MNQHNPNNQNYPQGGKRPYYPTPRQTGTRQPQYYSPTGRQNMHDLQQRNIIQREIDRVIPRHKKESLGTLEFRPRQVRFATQDKGERVYILVRRHWITNVGWAFRNMVYALLPFLVIYILTVFGIDLEFSNAKSLTLALIFYESIIFTNVVKEFLDWYYDPYIVTNQRVLDYDFRPFSSYTIKETALYNIENVKEKSGGVLANIFNLGDLTILTASSTTQGELNFTAVPNPSEIRNVMQDLTTIYKKFDDEFRDRP